MNTLKENHLLRQFVIVVTFVLTLVVNYLSNALPLNGRTAGEISDALPSLITPAGYAFAIWGLIYTALTGFVIYQALPQQRRNPHIRRIGYLFVLTNLANAGWLLAWHYGFYPLSVFVMLILLVTLIAIYVRLDIGKPAGEGEPARSTADKWLVHLPFSLYLGWITVATIVNIASVLNWWGWNGFGLAESTWSAIMMLVAAGVTGVLLVNRIDFAYAGVIVWALLAIMVKHMAIALVANTAVAAAVLVVVFALVGWYRNRNQKETYRPKPA